MQRIYAVGDIHGCLDKLIALMDIIDIDYQNDLLVFLGDYIDRGPHSYEVVEYLLDLKSKAPQTIFLKGNHEWMFEAYLSGGDKLSFLAYGGHATLESYMRQYEKGKSIISEMHTDFYQSLSLIHENENYIFVHAGLKPKIEIEKQDPLDLLMIRDKFIKSDFDFGKKIIFGHTPLSKPLIEANKIGIDTGAVYGNKLTCLKLPDMVFFQS